jgi:hypothetical protein
METRMTRLPAGSQARHPRSISSGMQDAKSDFRVGG